MRVAFLLGMALMLAACQQGPVMAPDEASFDPKLPKIYLFTSDSPRQVPRVEGVVIVVEPLSGSRLAGLTDDPNTIGAITIGGSRAIEAARYALDASMFPVIELIDDLYDRRELGPSVFQASIPHSWQAFRLARYFGPGDRNYLKVGLAREPSGQAVADSLSEALALRGITFIDAEGNAEAAVGKLQQQSPQAVVIEGSDDFRAAVVGTLGKESTRYLGKSKIADGWRPQLAGFDSLFVNKSQLAQGSVATSDYVRADVGLRIIQAARVLAQARTVAALERFDRIRLGHLPISLGPTDHILAERDVLGLWTKEQSGWAQLMKTFTSDLERTNILEEDWPVYFDGTTPGGEAPFYHRAKIGNIADLRHDLH